MERTDSLSSGVVPEGIIDVLEAVQVHDQDGPDPFVSDGQLELTLELLLKAAAIEQAGERVVIGQVAQALVQLAALGDVLDLRDPVEGPTVAVTHNRQVARKPALLAVPTNVAVLDRLHAAGVIEQQAAHELAGLVAFLRWE